MFLPSESDLPDPPLDVSGEIQLPPELVAVADRLRRESVIVAEAAVPQSAAAPLLRHAAAGGQRQTWRQVAITIAVCTVCASIAAIALILRHAAELERPLPNRSIPRIAMPNRLDRTTIANHEVNRDVFLSAQQGPSDPDADINLAIAGGSLTDQQRIELLERALDSYRNALSAQHQRLVELEAELKAAKERSQQQ